jgi:hypothetical protein
MRWISIIPFPLTPTLSLGAKHAQKLSLALPRDACLPRQIGLSGDLGSEKPDQARPKKRLNHGAEGLEKAELAEGVIDGQDASESSRACLALGERERQGPILASSNVLRFVDRLTTFLPLLEGEGWGEGKRSTELDPLPKTDLHPE